MYFFTVRLDDPEPLEIAIVELANGQSLRGALEELHKVQPNLLTVDNLIFRTPVARPINPEKVRKLTTAPQNVLPEELKFLSANGRDLRNTFDRVIGKSIHLLYSHDFDLYLSHNFNSSAPVSRLDSVSDGGRRGVLSEIKNAEIDSLVEAGKARLPQTEGVLYRAPSGDLVSSFLRIGNIQRSRSAIDGIFFWLLPHLKDCAGLVTETWSISSIALNASRRLAAYCSATPPVPVEMLDSYFSGTGTQTADAAERIERLIKLADSRQPRYSRYSAFSFARILRSLLPLGWEDGRVGKIVFLMSATNTGALHKRLVSQLAERGTAISRIHFVALFALGETATEIPSIRDLSSASGDGTYAPVSQSEKTDQAAKLDIDPQTYFPTNYIDVTHVVRKSQVKEIEEFISRYKGSSLIKVHKHTTDDGAVRHQGIWIDTVELSRNQVFQQRLISALNSLEPTPQLIITPVHSAADELAQLALKTIRQQNSNVRHFKHRNLLFDEISLPEDTEVREAISELAEDAAILILDDAFIAGTRIANYRTGLRLLNFRGLVHYLVAVARPADMAEWENRSKLLAYRSPQLTDFGKGNTVIAVEKFVLPDMSEDSCPWCREQKFYERIGRHQLTPRLKERSVKLAVAQEAGMEDGLFLRSEPGRLTFTPGSIFAPEFATEAAVFASVASGVQALRCKAVAKQLNKPPLAPPHFPLNTVLDYDDCFLTTYTDSMLKACFLRAARPFELIYSDKEVEKSKSEFIRKQLLEASEMPLNEIGAEILLGKLEGKFPQLSLSENGMPIILTRLKLDRLFASLMDSIH